MAQTHDSWYWSGDSEPFLDTPAVTLCGHVAIGRYGGTTDAGAYKNEDAALVWTAPDTSWTFAALLDAHGSSESANLVLGRIADLEDEITHWLGNPADSLLPFRDLTTRFARHFEEEDFRRACAAVRGETALLLCAQKDACLWWLSVGDIPVYVFHPEFARLGQFALNQRMFFEWIGHVNTFALPTPCYTTGVRQLRPGRSQVLLTTDGLLECGTRSFADPARLYEHFYRSDVPRRRLLESVQETLNHVLQEQGRDSATLLSWEIDVPDSLEIMQPSA